MGVSHRILQLADRQEGYVKEGARPFESLAPLPEVIGASTGHAASGKKVQGLYERMLERLGTEFAILRELPLEAIRQEAGERVAEGIRRPPGRAGDPGTGIRRRIRKDPAVYRRRAGEYRGPAVLFLRCAGEWRNQPGEDRKTRRGTGTRGENSGQETPAQGTPSGEMLNPEQLRAVRSESRYAAVTAGPGTGKTKTLVSRILYLLQEKQVKPREITAVTFTRKAAAELRERLEKALGGKAAAAGSADRHLPLRGPGGPTLR